VCAVGGINTVLRTKGSISIAEMGDQYCMIGPYIEKNIKTEVELIEPPNNGTIHKVIERMKLYGFKVCGSIMLYTLTGNLHK